MQLAILWIILTIMQLFKEFADGQISGSDRCFRKYPNCIIVNYQPFDRKTVISLEDCKENCLSKQSGPIPCKAFVYAISDQVCDLFDSDGTQMPPMRIQFPNRDLYVVTGLCNQTTTPTTIPPTEIRTCPLGQAPKFSKLPNFALQGSDDITVNNVDEAQCLNSCSTNRRPDGSEAKCRAVNYIQSSRTCSISSNQVALPEGQGQLRETPGTIYYQKFCALESKIQGCPESFPREPQMLLVGIATEVVSASSTEDCMRKCLETAEFKCRAGMFFIEIPTANCVLSQDDSSTHPELKTSVDPQDDVVDYFELKCGAKSVLTMRDLSVAQTTTFAAPTTTSEPIIFQPPRFFSFLEQTPNKELNVIRPRNFNASGVEFIPSVLPPRPIFPLGRNSGENRVKICQIGECCPYRDSCIMGMRSFGDGRSQWCLAPCA